MAVYPLIKVEPFTDRVQGHTPVAVLLNSDELEAPAMQTISRQINMPETVFVSQSDNADFGIRCFNRIGEQRMRFRCMVAAIYALADAKHLLLGADPFTLSIEANGRLTPVELISRDGSMKQVVITKKGTPEFLTIHHPETVSVFGIAWEELYPYVFVQTLGRKSQHVLIAVKYLETMRRIQLKATAYADWLAAANFAGVHIYCLCGATQHGRTYSRHFGTVAGAYEEPFSVSGICNMAVHSWLYGMLEQPKFVAEHGPRFEQPRQAFVEIVGTRGQVQAIKVGGTAVIVTRDQYYYER